MSVDRKSVIWLAGDSTLQSYSEDQRPQWGWGEKLLELLENRKYNEESRRDNQGDIVICHRADCPFPQQKRYEGQYYIVDNCAMAGRSSRTFQEEGRLADIESHIQQGDYMLIQFGHNDAGKSKPERYVELAAFRESLSHYVRVAQKQKAFPIFLSSIVLCPSQQVKIGEGGEIDRLLPKYAKVMEQYAAELGIPYIDMNGQTRNYIEKLSMSAAREHYLSDHVHLVEKGAFAYAQLAAEELKKYLPHRRRMSKND